MVDFLITVVATSFGFILAQMFIALVLIYIFKRIEPDALPF